MTARETLEACRAKVTLVHLLSALIDIIRFPSNGCRSPMLTGMPRGGNDNLRAAVERLEYAEEWYATEKPKMDALMEQVKALLSGLDVISQQVMWLYYAEAMSEQEVADSTGIRWQQSVNARRLRILEKLGETA